jgi:transposase-like protein
MSVFKPRRCPVEIILLCLRWSCEETISDRDLAGMVATNAAWMSTTRRSFAGSSALLRQIEKRARGYQGLRSGSWRVDETYVRVGGTWTSRGCGIDKQGRLIDVMCQFAGIRKQRAVVWASRRRS